MARSMTGYGAAAVQTDVLHASATVRSLNHRYLDLSVHLPRNMAALEPEVKELVQARIARGKVDVSLFATLTAADTPAQVVALPFTGELVKTLRALREQHALAGDVTLGDIARFGAVEVVEAPVSLTPEQRETLLGAVEKALAELARMREAEGANVSVDLERRLVANVSVDLERRLVAIEQAVARIEGLMESSRAARIAALREKVGGLTAEMGLEEPRLYQEVVRLVDRQDTTEEIERTRSHVAQARGLLKSPEAVGKRLDFLAQELNREANTIGSKASAASVIQEVVGLKAEIEKLREQVQNVE